MTKIKTMVALVAMLTVMVVGAAPAYAAPQDPGPVGWRELPSFGSAYCDNFYDGPPMATTPSGAPWADIQQQHVYWCYPEITGYWIPVGATSFL